MRKQILFALGLLATSACAQNKMILTKVDGGETIEFNTSSISEVNFEESTNSCTIVFNNQEVKDFNGNIAKISFKKQHAIDGTNARTISHSVGLGWNLGNQMDAQNNGVAIETGWGNPATTQQCFNKLKEYGFSTIRIPITWMGHIDDNNNYKIDERWMSRVEEIVGYAENAGLKAIINIHHDGAESKYWLSIKKAAENDAENAKIKEKIAAVWTQIAERFKEKGDFLIFESFNEIHDGGWGYGGTNNSDGGKQYGILNDWNQLFVDVVRATGYENTYRYLGVPGYSTNPQLTKDYLKVPNDPSKHVMVAVHCYDPYDYAIPCKYNQWGHTANPNDKPEWGEESSIDWTFGFLKETYIDKNVPCYLGEYGAVHRATEQAEAFRLYYMEYVTKSAMEHGLGCLFWDNGSKASGNEAFGVVNHADGSFINNGKDVVDIMVRAYYNTDPNYTLQSIYNRAPNPF